MKAMISQPMNGKTEEEILVTKEKAVKSLIEKGYEVHNTYFEDFKADDSKNIPLKYLAKSLDEMSKCDAVYFCNGWEKARGCRIEHDAAVAYGLRTFYEEEE